MSAPDTVRYGGQTTCFALQSHPGHDELLIVDAGTGIYPLGRQLQKNGPRRIHLILSHLHQDHVCGFPFFAPLFDRRFEIRVSAPFVSPKEVSNALHALLHPPLSPVTWANVAARLQICPAPGPEDRLAGLTVTAIPLAHPGKAAGLCCTSAQGRRVVVVPDNELAAMTAEQRLALHTACSSADLLIHDAHFLDAELDGARGWGHSSPLEAARLGLETRVQQVGLTHHHPDRNDDSIEAIEKQTRDWLSGFPDSPECTALAAGWSLNLPEAEKKY
ncbi:MBL fold metallo-hydrolase [Desulfohalobium retbaense]|uniref:MBL fold metallo-hydrolase n=1 Tax=Desulfohalobium retbaense TaxID=45663 RepID=UPI00019B3E31|nr:MBL fold metallo-hydrolase [Desulfohalobium retbaense]